MIAVVLIEMINLVTDSYLKKTFIGLGTFGSIIMGVGYLTIGLYFAKLDGGIIDAKTED